MESLQGLNKYDIKVANRIMVIELLENNPPLSRIQLAKMTGMSPTSMTRIINELMDLNLVKDVECEYKGIGRKSSMLSINPDAFYVLGLYICSSKISFCIMNYKLEALSIQEYPCIFSSSLTSVDLVDFCYEKYLIFIADFSKKYADFSMSRIKMMGISFPGTVDSYGKYIISSPCFHWKKETNFCKYCEEKFALPIAIENDIKASIYNEYHRHPSHRADSVAFLSLDYGTGCSFMLNGKILKGFHSGAGEIAHIVFPNDTLCSQSCCGHIARQLCYSGILRRAASSGLKVSSMKELNSAYHTGDSAAIELFNELSSYIACMINIILCLYNPEKIILGGLIFHEAPVLLSLALKNQDLFYQEISEDIIIEFTHEEKEEPLWGCAVIALHNYRTKLIETSFN